MATIIQLTRLCPFPNIRGGQRSSAGKVRLDVIASYLYRGLSVEELAVNFALDLGQAHAALAYYYQHKAEIDAQMRADNAKLTNLLAEFDAQGKLIRVD